MALPAVNIVIEKGTDFESTYFISNPDGSVFNLTGYSAIAKIKKYPSSPTSVPFSVSLVASSGQVKISMASTTTALLSEGRHYYDIVVVSQGYATKTKVIEGNAIVSPSASV